MIEQTDVVAVDPWGGFKGQRWLRAAHLWPFIVLILSNLPDSSPVSSKPRGRTRISGVLAFPSTTLLMLRAERPMPVWPSNQQYGNYPPSNSLREYGHNHYRLSHTLKIDLICCGHQSINQSINQSCSIFFEWLM